MRAIHSKGRLLIYLRLNTVVVEQAPQNKARHTLVYIYTYIWDSKEDRKKR